MTIEEDRLEPLHNYVDPDQKPLYPESEDDAKRLQDMERVVDEVRQGTADRAEVESLVKVIDKYPKHFRGMPAASKLRHYLKKTF